LIGDGNGTYASSPNAEWIIWTDNSKYKSIHSYNVIHQMNCNGIGGEGSFVGWEEKPTNGLYPLQADSLIKSAKEHYHQHQLDLAISDYLKAIQADPYKDDAYGLLGYAYYRNNQLPQAQDALQLSIRINPKNSMSFYNLTLVLWAEDQKSSAIDQLKYLFSIDNKYISLVSEDTQFHEIIHDPKYVEMIKSLNP
jgi:tetratricopeptide (TPR) repeat protein